MPRTIAVTDLADYAADPADHLQRGGGPRNRAAARAGRRAHAMFRSRLGRNALVLVVGGVLAAALFYAPHETANYALWVFDQLRRGFLWLVEQL